MKAVSEEKRMLDAIETARALGYRDGHIDGRKEARSQFAKPSAEGDGWIAVDKKGMEDVIYDLEVMLSYLPDSTTYGAVKIRQRLEKFKASLPAPPSGQGEKR